MRCIVRTFAASIRKNDINKKARLQAAFNMSACQFEGVFCADSIGRVLQRYFDYVDILNYNDIYHNKVIFNSLFLE